jgi:membrane-bound lytic murein transglycosylase B
MRRFATAIGIFTLAVTGCGGGRDGGRDGRATPAPTPTGTVTPTAPAGLAEIRAQALAAVDAWRRDGDPATGPPPAAVTVPAQRLQERYRDLARHPRRAAAALGRLDGAARADARDVIDAQRALRVLNAPFARARPKLRVRDPEPAGRLLAHYREARQRSGIGMPLLAAVNLVESAFGRLRNDSVAGAQGPMQFMPATWAGYGRGGNVHDPHDAILGAARFLRAGGAPRDERGALYRYNPSRLYVRAVTGYARVIRRDPRSYFVLYAWRAPVP